MNIWVNPLLGRLLHVSTVTHWILTIWINQAGFSNVSKWLPKKKVNLAVKYWTGGGGGQRGGQTSDWLNPNNLASVE